MNGFEYQVAGHMIWEGLVHGGPGHHPHGPRPLPRRAAQSVERSRVRRPLRAHAWPATACSWPPAASSTTARKGHLGFAPRLTPENFRAAFTTAEGWGTFSQKRSGGKQTETIELKAGRLELKSLEFAVPENTLPTQVTVTAAGQSLTVTMEAEAGRVRIAFAAPRRSPPAS